MALDRLSTASSGQRVGPLLLNADEWPLRIVCKELDLHPQDLRPCRAIGVIRDNTLVAGVVYSGFRPEQQDCEMTIAALTPRWASRQAISMLLAYPFKQLECRRVTARVRGDNERALRFDLGVGFKVEGRMRSWYEPGVDAIVLGMLAEEWREGPYYVEG